MSGVEAIFGVIAGGASFVSLAIQLGESAAKLKRIYHMARNAPQIITRLVFGLETMAMALEELEQHRQHYTHSEALLARCIIECQQSTAEIQQLVDKMERHMANYGKLGKLYTAFKERDIKKLLDDLGGAKSTLELAYMIYLAAEQRRRDQALQAQVSAGNVGISRQLTLLLQSAAPSQPPQVNVPDIRTPPASQRMVARGHEIATAETSDDHEHIDQCDRPLPVRQVKRKNSRERFRIRFRLPTWLYSRIWELAMNSAQCRWSMHLRTYNVVSPNSLIFEYCSFGDVAGMQRLFESGEASPLDIRYKEDGWVSSQTLIEAAARCVQPEVCRYLLNQTSCPDQATILSKALGWFALVEDGSGDAEMYRLFIEAPGFDSDLDDARVVYRWLHNCGNIQRLEIILQNQFPRFYYLPVEARFALAVRVGLQSRMEPSDFLKCIGLQQSDQRLASLTSGSGISVLHYIARRLSDFSYRVSLPNEWRKWLDLGVRVLRNGADPSSIAQGDRSWDHFSVEHHSHVEDSSQERWQTTPLLDHLRILHWEIDVYTKALAEQTLEDIRMWTEMIQQAGLDLREYGAKETQAWKSLGLENPCEYDHRAGRFPNFSSEVKHLVYGSTPADWSLMIYHIWYVPIYMLHPLPGTFTQDLRLPTTIMWSPTDEERNEGPWEFVETKKMVTQPVDLRDIVVQSTEPFTELVDSAQDDSGVVMLIRDRASRARSSASRSHSQPPCMRPREAAYSAVQKSFKHYWLGTYHRCPFDSRWHLDRVSEVDEYYMDTRRSRNGVAWDYNYVRSCAEGMSDGRFSIQESWTWYRQSFLSFLSVPSRQHQSEPVWP